METLGGRVVIGVGSYASEPIPMTEVGKPRAPWLPSPKLITVVVVICRRLIMALNDALFKNRSIFFWKGFGVVQSDLSYLNIKLVICSTKNKFFMLSLVNKIFFVCIKPLMPPLVYLY